MAIITLPAKFAFTRVERFGLMRAGATAQSRYTGKTQRVVYPYAVWAFEGTLVDYPEPEAAAIRSFFIKLEGAKNNFRLPVPGYSRPANQAFYNHLVSIGDNKTKSINARDTSIVLNYAPLANVVNAVNEGEYVNINGELKVITSVAHVVANGDVGFTFQPPMRSTNAAAVVKFLNPTILMFCPEDDAAVWGLQAPVRHGFKLSAIEEI